jgi:phosphatidylglycerophosphate synthase
MNAVPGRMNATRARLSRTGPATGLIAQVLLLAVLAGTAGLGAAGWIVGVACAVIMAAALARGLARGPGDRLEPASRVTLVRATLAVGVAALTADSFTRDAPVALLVTLASVALALDAVDGWVARRTGTASALGARFDGEVDAFLILALSVYVAPASGAWVLAIGAARYLFLAGEWLLPWMRTPLPPRRWRRLVAAAQGIVLTVAAAEVLPRALTQALLVAALAALAASVGECTWWLWRRRDAARDQVPEGYVGRPERGPLRTGIAVALTVLAVLVVWAALVAPHQPGHFTLGAFTRLPVEILVVAALAVVLPATPRRVLAVLVGAVLGVLVLVKALDVGFYTVFDRPFNPFDDWSHRGTAIETLRDSFGKSHADLALAVALAAIAALFVVLVAALLRLTRVAADHHGRALPAIAALGVVWMVLRVLGAPVASTSAVALAVDQVQAVRTGLQDRATLAHLIARDRFRATPGDRLLTGLRGKDVLVLFVEAYGRVAVQGSSISPRINAVLDQGAAELRGAGFSARSAFLKSPTYGGISWLAHSTLQSGIWINSQRRYSQLVQSQRFTLSQAFKRAGWRAVGDAPVNNRTWVEGSSFYHYDKVYDSRNVGYRGPRFGYPTMPDQYVLLALQRLELGRRHRPALFAEVDLISSHVPWARVPQLIPWDDVGDGSVFHRVPVLKSSRDAVFSDLDRARAAYSRSIEYTLSAIFSFVQRYGDRDLVLVVLGDHQPARIVTGQAAGHDVPISVIAHDPEVLDRIAGWDWQDGLRPSPRAPVWRMDAFRDRFLTAFGSSPADG